MHMFTWALLLGLNNFGIKCFLIYFATGFTFTR